MRFQVEIADASLLCAFCDVLGILDAEALSFNDCVVRCAECAHLALVSSLAFTSQE